MTIEVSIESVRCANRKMIAGRKPDMEVCGDKVSVYVRTSVYEGSISFSKKKAIEAGRKALRKFYERGKSQQNNKKLRNSFVSAI